MANGAREWRARIKKALARCPADAREFFAQMESEYLHLLAASPSGAGALTVVLPEDRPATIAQRTRIGIDAALPALLARMDDRRRPLLVEKVRGGYVLPLVAKEFHKREGDAERARRHRDKKGCDEGVTRGVEGCDEGVTSHPRPAESSGNRKVSGGGAANARGCDEGVTPPPPPFSPPPPPSPFSPTPPLTPSPTTTPNPTPSVVCPATAQPSAGPSEPPDRAAEVVMSFPIDGAGEAGRWGLTRERALAFKAAFPTTDVRGEFAKARLWLENNPGRRKTARGMPRFLQSWLENHVNRRRGGDGGSGGGGDADRVADRAIEILNARRR